MPNAEEIAYWNDEAGARWASFYERIDRAFAPLSAAALARAAVRAGESVLDIGCGTGATSLELAAAAAPAGVVAAVDVSRTMLAVAQARGHALERRNANFILADASTHAFEENAYDLAFSRFGVMFFDDPAVAFANVRPALRPAGRLVFVCWRELGANPWFRVPLDAVRAHVPAPPKVAPDAPGPLSFADPGRVRDVLERANFRDVTFEAFDALLPFGTPVSALELLSKIGPASALIAGGNDRERAAAEAALAAALAGHEADGEVRLGAGVWIVSAAR